MKQKKILEEMKKLSHAERIELLEGLLALVREELKERVHTKPEPNAKEAQSLAGILLTFRDLDQPLMEDEIDRQLVEAAKLLQADYAPGGELRMVSELSNEDIYQYEKK